jgi:predicted lipoprotein with Yx(FWY)xxD motif
MPIDQGVQKVEAGRSNGWLLATIAIGLALIGLTLLHPAFGNAAPGAIKPTVSTSSTALGRILVDSRGRTLYLFERDRNGKSACAGQCAAAWPPLIASAKPSAGTGVKAALIGTTRRADGRLQVTYNHHPLYTFVKDTKAGQTNGQNVDAFGAEWYVVSPAGTTIEKSAAPTSGGSGSSGYGYGS